MDPAINVSKHHETYSLSVYGECYQYNQPPNWCFKLQPKETTRCLLFNPQGLLLSWRACTNAHQVHYGIQSQYLTVMQHGWSFTAVTWLLCSFSIQPQFKDNNRC